MARGDYRGMVGEVQIKLSNEEHSVNKHVSRFIYNMGRTTSVARLVQVMDSPAMNPPELVLLEGRRGEFPPRHPTALAREL